MLEPFRHKRASCVHSRVRCHSVLWTGVTLDNLVVRSSDPPSSQSLDSSLAQSSLITITRLSITFTSRLPWEDLPAPRDPSASLPQASNLSDSQIIDNLLSSVEKQIFTLIIHSVGAGISSPSLPQSGATLMHGCKRQCLNGNEHSFSSLFAPPFASPSVCFPSIFYLFSDNQN